jgi:hypothetical protein
MIIIIIIMIISCKSNVLPPDETYGEKVYYDHCVICHGLSEGIEDVVPFRDFTKMDTSILLRKLDKIRDDTLHIPFLSNNRNISNRETQSVYLFIRRRSQLSY